MTAEEIRDHLIRRPFMPFRAHLTDGSHHDVRHPEMAFLTRYSLEIAAENQGDIPERVHYCSLLHIARVETLSTTPA
jgi:hypothetical protein